MTEQGSGTPARATSLCITGITTTEQATAFAGFIEEKGIAGIPIKLGIRVSGRTLQGMRAVPHGQYPRKEDVRAIVDICRPHNPLIVYHDVGADDMGREMQVLRQCIGQGTQRVLFHIPWPVLKATETLADAGVTERIVRITRDHLETPEVTCGQIRSYDGSITGVLVDFGANLQSHLAMASDAVQLLRKEFPTLDIMIGDVDRSSLDNVQRACDGVSMFSAVGMRSHTFEFSENQARLLFLSFLEQMTRP